MADSTPQRAPGDLTGRVSVVTGAARGIGREAAVALARRGAAVAGIDIAGPVSPILDFAPATPDDLTETGKAVEGAGSRWLAIPADQRDIGAIRAAAERVEREWGGVDIVFANAGIQAFKPILEMDDRDWHDQIDVNLNGTANVLRVFAPLLVRRGGGRIVITSSTQGEHGTKFGSSYSASKWGLIGLMKSAALELGSYGIMLWDRNKDWSVEEIELDPPKQGEVLVALGGSGLCHSDEHVLTGDLPWPLPMIGGHEGAGVVQEVGPGVTGLAPGDRVIFSFLPVCGVCRACARGMSNLCEFGMYLGAGTQISDHTARHHARGQDLGLMCLPGTFAEHTVVSQANCVKIEDDLPLDVACLLGCGVITGWGAVAYTGEARAGDVVAVVGVGGIGINAVQGAVAVGAEYVVAVDPVAFKRDKALEFGATHAVATSQEAAALLTELTRGQMAQVCVNTMGIGEGDQIAASLALVGKRGRVVVTNLHRAAETQVAMSALELTLFEKQVRGSLFGSSNPRADIPRMLELHRSGKLKLEELRTRTYSLDEVNAGYDDMRNGRNLRGVIIF